MLDQCRSRKIDRYRFNLQWTGCGSESEPRSVLTLTNITSSPVGLQTAKYCNEYVCLSVCSHHSLITQSNFTECMLPTAMSLATFWYILWLTSCFYIMALITLNPLFIPQPSLQYPPLSVPQKISLIYATAKASHHGLSFGSAVLCCASVQLNWWILILDHTKKPYHILSLLRVYRWEETCAGCVGCCYCCMSQFKYMLLFRMGQTDATPRVIL